MKELKRYTAMQKLEYYVPSLALPLDDLSWSAVVSMVQGDKNVAGELINECAIELQKQEELLKQIIKELRKTEFKISSLQTGAKYVAEHMGLDLPLTIMQQGYIVTLTEDGLTINNNCI